LTASSLAQHRCTMVRLTLIARKHDGLPLSEGLDSDNHHDMEPYKQQAKVQLIKLHTVCHNTDCRLTAHCWLCFLAATV